MATVLSKGAKAADNLLGCKRREIPNILHLCSTRFTSFLYDAPPVARHIGRHPILRLRLHRRDERGVATMGTPYPEVN